VCVCVDHSYRQLKEYQLNYSEHIQMFTNNMSIVKGNDYTSKLVDRSRRNSERLKEEKIKKKKSRKKRKRKNQRKKTRNKSKNI